jgi:hypothetical protein
LTSIVSADRYTKLFRAFLFFGRRAAMAAREFTSRAYARVGLVGNPSDGFGGKKIAVSVENYSATVTIRESAHICFEPNPHCDSLSGFASLALLHDKLARDGYQGGIILLQATCKRFHEYCTEHKVTLPHRNFTLSYDTNIPRQVRCRLSFSINRAGAKGRRSELLVREGSVARLRGSTLAQHDLTRRDLPLPPDPSFLEPGFHFPAAPPSPTHLYAGGAGRLLRHHHRHPALPATLLRRPR